MEMDGSWARIPGNFFSLIANLKREDMSPTKDGRSRLHGQEPDVAVWPQTPLTRIQRGIEASLNDRCPRTGNARRIGFAGGSPELDDWISRRMTR
jgi:hypothetical protein